MLKSFSLDFTNKVRPFFFFSSNAFCFVFSFFFFLIQIKEAVYFLKLPYTYSLIFTNRAMFQRFVSLFVSNLISKFSAGFFVELEIRGLGFRLFKSRFFKNIFKLYVGHSHWIYLFGSKNILIKARKKSLFFFSYNRAVLFDLLSQIVMFRGINPYKIKGLIFPGSFFIMKSSKQR